MITKSSLELFFKKIADIALENYDDFNTLDGQLGDGDLGITISKGLLSIKDNLSQFDDDLGKLLWFALNLLLKHQVLVLELLWQFRL